MGSTSSTYVEPKGTGDPHPDVVNTTGTPVEGTMEVKVISDPADPEDVRILNWIGKFIKPLEERVQYLEKRVDFLTSLSNPPSVILVEKDKE